jgi:5-methylthioadenosine/S-adenosylhomocysteine deaminase
VSLLIRDAILDGALRSILVRDGRIAAVLAPGEAPPELLGDRGGPGAPATAGGVDRIIDARGLHAFPSFKNGHTHVAMVLLRGYGDDMPLMEWLQTRIWPAEGRLTREDVYNGARLGILEMIRGGTTFLNEMYWHRPAIVRAVEEMGVRGLVGSTLIDLGDPAMLEAQRGEMLDLVEARSAGGEHDRTRLSLAPHSIYTVPPDVLSWVAGLAREHDLTVHIHLSETEGEVERCLEEHGCRPAVLLDRLGLVGPGLVAVHGQFLDQAELELLGDAGATLVTNPTANLKLATGGIFPYRAARQAGVRVCLGTDGAASNNNLDLLEEMKVAALVQKHREGDATVLPSTEALAMATSSASEAFRLGPGRLERGASADLVLLDFSGPSTQPVHDPVSTLVYAANASHVHTTICAGRVLMHDRRVEVCDEAEVIAAALETVDRLVGGTGA